MTKKLLLLLSLFLAPYVLIAADMSKDDDLNKSKTVAINLKKTLGGLLKQKLQTDGPAGALVFCSDSAMPLTKRIAEENEAVVRRVSFKNRNSLNLPDELDSKALNEYAKYKNEAEAPKYLVLKDEKTGGSRYYEPMYVVGMCLVCHGDTAKMSEAVKSELAKKYPNDKAVGYNAGDFRGLIVVELKK